MPPRTLHRPALPPARSNHGFSLSKPPSLPLTGEASADKARSPRALARAHWQLAAIAGLFGVGLLSAEAIAPWWQRPQHTATTSLDAPPTSPPAEIIEDSRRQIAESAAIVRGQADPNWQPQMRPVQPLNVTNYTAQVQRQSANATSYYSSYQNSNSYTNYQNSPANRFNSAQPATNRPANRNSPTNSPTNSSNFNSYSNYNNSYSNGYNNGNPVRNNGNNSGSNYNRNINQVNSVGNYAGGYNPNYVNPYGNSGQGNQWDRSGRRTSWQQGSFPVENFQTYTSPFGYRRRGGSVEFHKGLDLAAPKGSYIRSWWAGRVIRVSDGGLCGTAITIQSGAWEHTYCHMMGRVATWQGRRYLSDPDGGLRIFQGQTVTTGMRVGRVGMTGRTTGPHLHWGIKYGKDWIDPALVLRAMYQQQARN